MTIVNWHYLPLTLRLTTFLWCTCILYHTYTVTYWFSLVNAFHINLSLSVSTVIPVAFIGKS